MPSPILTASEMRDTEERAMTAGISAETLMKRAGLAVAEAAWRFAGPLPTLVLCGPGNNGGDGYVAARYLRERGVHVRVAALGEPKAGAAAAARALWDGPVVGLDGAEPAPLLIDALFGTGLTRGLDAALAARLCGLARQARAAVAVDLPSGVASDTGAILSDVLEFDLTVTFATLKPAHLLHPSAARCGRVAVADVGIDAGSALSKLTRPSLPPPGPGDHKFSRGYVAVVAGNMPGAAALAVEAAARAGAGYVRLVTQQRLRLPNAIIQSDDPSLDDERIGAIVIGPGLGRDGRASAALDRALATGRPLVLDGDALHLLGNWPKGLHGHVITPHEGEFSRMFDGAGDSKVERARTAAFETGAVVVYKGADTVVAAPDGRAAIAGDASPWLSTAGTGDVLAGVIAAMIARGLPLFNAAKAGVWLHDEAARRAGKAFVADDLLRLLSDAL